MAVLAEIEPKNQPASSTGPSVPPEGNPELPPTPPAWTFPKESPFESDVIYKLPEFEPESPVQLNLPEFP